MPIPPSRDPPPLVGLPCCTRAVGEHPGQWVGEKYVRAVREAARALPALLPALEEPLDAEDIAARLDGLLLTGSRSNVEPHHYEGSPSVPGTHHDPARDKLTLPLIRAAMAADLPILAICRGIQELNVALGGTLHQRLHELEGRLDHRAPDGDADRRYGHLAHPVSLTPGGWLAGFAGAPTVMVNSLHSQGIDRLAPGLMVEAVAPDGQIEAVRHAAATFVVGVQWHPEYRVMENRFGGALFAAFGRACRDFRRHRERANPAGRRVPAAE